MLPAGVLPEDDVAGHLLGGIERLHPAQHLDLLVADRVRVERDRRLHSGQADELEHVVLDHVAQDAGFLVVAAPSLDAQLLAGGDLDVIDEAPVPDGLEDGVREPEHQEVLDRLFSQVVVDAEDLALVAGLQHQPVQGARAGQVAPERSRSPRA